MNIKVSIPLIRIPYWKANTMETFLFDEMVKYNAIEPIKIALNNN